MNKPQTELANLLERAEAIKQEMTRLLIELETQATGQRPVKPGHWRHHPTEWARNYPPR